MKLGFGVLGLLCLWTIAADAAPDKAVLAPAFTASPKDLLSAASRAAASDAPVVVLRKENVQTYDDKGRGASRFRMIYVVRTAAGVDDWGTLSSTWRPFYQDKPVLRARVIEPSGRVSDLDPSLIHDAPAVSDSPTVYSDLRDIEAPLPRLQIGSVVEVEITTTDRVPLLDAGSVDRFTYASGVINESVTLVISAPASRKVTVIPREIKIKPKHAVANGIETWTFELGRLDPSDDDESSLPSDVVEYPFVGITTGASWSAVARDYKKILDKRLADGPFALPATLKGPPTMDTVHAIVAWLHAQIRYTGIEFGQASITPWPPAETVKRGFGDCKDKAILLVALLRQAGFRADLAILSTGPGQDVDRALPGLGEFDHAIVRAIVAGKPVWIDGTEDLHRAGTLPLRDQGRLALIVADDTRDLVLTPRSTSADNVVREVRTYKLSEFGPGEATEVSHEGGLFDAPQRTWIRDSRADKVREDLKAYAQTEYGGELDSYTTTSPTDLAKPFQVTTVVARSDRAFTTREKIAVLLYPGDAFDKLPSDFTKHDPKAKPRVHDFDLWRPHRYVIENRLVFPPGFTPPTPAAERKRTLGVATFVERQKLDGNVFVVTFELDSGPSRLKPAELEATTKALAELRTEERTIPFVLKAAALADSGKFVEAIASIEELIKLHPKEAIHYTQLGLRYLAAGAGPAARRAARRAVELEPKNADVQGFLAYVLRHDSFGRDLGFDHDRAGAIAANRKALELDPKAGWVAENLGNLLEAGPNGRTTGADLPGAIAAYETALKINPTDATAFALARVYLRANKAADAERVLRARDASKERDYLLVTAIGLQQGGAAAIAAVSQLSSDRKTTLDAAGGMFMTLREYDLLREMYTASGSINSQQARLFGKVKRRTKLDAKAPRTAVVNAFIELVDVPPKSATYWDTTTRDEIMGVNAIPPNMVTAMRKLGDELWADISSTALTVTVEGRPNGPWRAELDMLGQKSVFYIALDKGVAKVIAAQGRIAGLGRHAQRISGDPVGVQQLLDWARAEVDGGQSRATWFANVWGPNIARDAKSAVVAASVLAAPAGTRAVLDACASPAPDARASCDGAIGYQLWDQQKWSELEKHATTAKVDPKDVLNWRVAAAMWQKKFDVADKALAEWVAIEPTSPMHKQARLDLALARGDDTEAFRLFEESLKASPIGTRNNLAWLMLARTKDLPRAISLARDEANASKAEHVLNTYAAVAAETGDLQTAVRQGIESMVQGSRTTPSAADWLVFATIAEKLGLRDDAIAAYKKVTPPARPQNQPSSYDIARARLARLGVK